jgi:hypothetical protein
VTRLANAWRAMEPERRLAVVAALAMLVTMFFPWYGLQSLNRKTGAIYSHNISAFGDVSFVEAAVFLVAAAVIAMLLARAEGRQFHMPGGDGTIVMIAGGWASLLIFYRVFSRPDGNGYPVGIEWGFFLAFVAAGSLALAGWRMRAGERPEPPLRSSRRPPRRTPVDPDGPVSASRSTRPLRGLPAPVPARAAPVEQAAERERPRFPPAPAGTRPASPPTRASTPAPAPARGATPEQLSFEDQPTRQE